MDSSPRLKPSVSVLVLGAKGQLGAELVKLNIDGYNIFGHYRRIHSLDDAYFVLEGIKPDVVINCAAYTDTSGAEKRENQAESKLVNSVLPYIVAKACNNLHIKFIHVSTNYVIPSHKGEVQEVLFDPSVASCKYGEHKSIGEHAVLGVSPTFSIVRIGNLMGFNWKIKRQMTISPQEMHVNPDVKIRPVSTPSTAKEIMRIVSNGKTGIHHYGSSDVIGLGVHLTDVFRAFYREVKIIDLKDRHDLAPKGSWLYVENEDKTHIDHIMEAMGI